MAVEVRNLKLIFGVPILTLLLSSPVMSEETKGQWYPVENIPNCSVWFSVIGKEDSTTWSGTCLNGHVHGAGVLKVKYASYEGKFEDGRLQGWGTLVAADVFKYEGEFKDTKMQGHGVLVMKGDVKYEGSFENNKMQGYGVMVMKGKMKYDGNFENNKAHGKGVVVVKDMYRYEGDFKNNGKDGYGIQEFLDGSRYEGQYVDNGRHGHGIWTLRDEKKCEGEWDKGQLVGLAKGWVNGQPRACVTEDYAVKFLD